MGHGLESFTDKITAFRIPDLSGSDNNIFFVDMPGFDGTRSDVDVLKLISDWLHSMYVVTV